MAISLVATFYVARTLGPQNFGELSYAVSVITLVSFFAAIASSTVICRDLVRRPDRTSEIIGTGWIISLFGTLATILLVVIFVVLVPHDRLTTLVISILLVAQIFPTLQIGNNVLVARAETKHLSLMFLFIHLCVSVAKIAAMLLDQGVLFLASIMLAEQVLAATISLALYRIHVHRSILTWRFDSSYAQQLTLDSFPFLLITMSAAIAGRIDQVFLKHYFDVTTVGLYNVAVQLTEVWQVLPLTLLATLYPALVNAHTTERVYRARLAAFAGALFVYGFMAAGLTALLAPLIVPLIYGPAYLSSIPLLQVYSFSVIGTIMGLFITNILITENFRRVQALVGIVPMITNVALNILFIPQYGAIGAAWATVISYSLAPLVPFLFFSFRSRFLVLGS
jgi:O-antigen/teichoic acid export membrane protein